MTELVQQSPSRFGRLILLNPTEKRIDGRIVWKCRCACGSLCEKIGRDVRNGHTKSCGCLARETTIFLNKKNKTTHGQTKTKTFKIWSGMFERCYNKKSRNYKNYGARGIQVCSRWSGKKGFEKFLFDMKEKPSNKTLERIDNNKNYSPQNCVWASKKEQANNRRNNIIYKGKTLAQWCEESSINYQKVWSRIKNLNWSFENALRP